MVGQAKLKSFHPDEATRAARIGWNALTAIYDNTKESHTKRAILSAINLMAKNGMFDKPGEVLQGPIEGDIGGTPVQLTPEEDVRHRDGWKILGED